MLTPDQRLRFARHLSLIELGDAGQLALVGAPLGPPLGDRAAEAVRADYLRRAGLSDAASAATEALDPRDVAVEALAGAPYLREAAACVLGAFLAVERIKELADVGQRSTLPPDFCLVPRATPRSSKDA